MVNNYIKNLIAINKTSNDSIASLEEVVSEMEIKNDKDKANFGNLCLILKANRIIAEATEAMLINENVLQDDNGNYYQKIEDEPIVPPTTEGKPGSDFDNDTNKK